MIVPLPKAQSKITDPTGIPTREWYNYFRSMLESAEGNPALEAQIQAILIRLEALEEGGTNFQLIGLDSVFVSGSPSNGLVSINLVNDSEDPGRNLSYGTNSDGEKGWVSQQHNELSGLQGGNEGEYFHITEDQFNSLSSFVTEAPIDGRQYTRGDGRWNVATGANEVYQRMTTSGDFRITSDGNLRITD